MQRTSHIVITQARAPGPRCAEALPTLQLPCLSTLLRTWRVAPRVVDPSNGLSSLYERAIAHALGWPLHDGLLPFAARQARQLGYPGAADSAWAQITPSHWEIANGHVRMPHPCVLALSDGESQALLQAMEPWFAEDGIRLHWVSALCWLAEGEPLRGLCTASVERASGETVDAWMPDSRALRRLQNEMQMLLYQHPVNDARVARRQPAINSFWISGTGTLPPAWQEPADVVLEQRLQDAAMADDAAAWHAEWQNIDATLLAPLATSKATPGSSIRITLCGPNASITLERQAAGLLQRLRQRWSANDAATFLNAL